MIASTSGAADACYVIAVILLLGCVACYAAILWMPSKQTDDTPVEGIKPTAPAKQSLLPTYGALLGWAGVMVGWFGNWIA